MRTLTSDEKAGIISRYIGDPEALNAMFDALQAYREGEWSDSDMVRRKRALLDFVRGTSADDQRLLEQAVDMIIKGHAFSKQFEVTQSFHTRQGTRGNIQIRKGLRLELIGHGWTEPSPGVHVHPFRVMEGDKHLFSIELSDQRLGWFLKKGRLAAKA